LGLTVWLAGWVAIVIGAITVRIAAPERVVPTEFVTATE